MKDCERDEELSDLANKVWPGAWVECDKWFDAPAHLQALKPGTGNFEGANIIMIEIVEHPNMRESMRAALCALLGANFYFRIPVGSALRELEDD